MLWVMGEDSHGQTSRRLELWCPVSALQEPRRTGLVGVPSTTWLCGSGEVAPFLVPRFHLGENGVINSLPSLPSEAFGGSSKIIHEVAFCQL